MALILNGVDQYALRAKSAVDYRTSLYSMFAYINRDDVNAFMAAFGTDRESSFRRSHGIVNQYSDPNNSIVFEEYGGSSAIDVLKASTPGEWVPVLFQKLVASGTGSSWEAYIGDSTAIPFTAGYGGLDLHTHQILGAHRAGGSPIDFFSGKLAHWAVWEQTNLTSQDILDLMDNGVAPSGIATTPTVYDSLVNTSSQFTLAGSAIVDEEDPLATGPALSAPASISPGTSGQFTVTGLAEAPTSATVSDGTSTLTLNNIALVSGDTYSFDTPALPAVGASLQYTTFGAVTMTVGDGTSTAQDTTSLAAATGQTVTTLAATFDTSELSYLFNFSGTPATGDQFIEGNAALALDANGGYVADTDGTYVITGIDATDGIAQSYELIVGPAAATAGRLTRRNLTRRTLTRRSLTARP